MTEADFDPYLDAGVLISADGRVFKQKPGAWLYRNSDRESSFTYLSDVVQSHKVERELCESIIDAQNQKGVPIRTGNSPDHINEVDTITIEPSPQTIIVGGVGKDGRELITSSAYPWRAVGVALFSPGKFVNTGSGCMIGPRHVLTAAHVINGNGSVSSLMPVVAAPGARGLGYSGNRWPYGRRWVQWYYWPNGWDGGNSLTDIRYDYALLILDDINWSPGWIRFGYQTTTWMDYKKFNTAGYPGNKFQCSNSPLQSGECGSYMYKQYERVTAVLPGYFYNKFDVQEGQS